MNRNQVDALLVQHGAALFWPRAVMGKMDNAGKLPLPDGRGGSNVTADAVRQRIRLVVSRAPVAVVKITGTATGMSAIRAHLRYITERGEVLRDDQGQEYRTPEDVKFFGDQFQYAGPPIPTEGQQRESFQIVFDMPPGTPSVAVREAVAKVAAREFAGHKWALAYHAHQRHPHVHLLVRARGRTAQRLDPRKADLRRWREDFAQELRALGVPAQANSWLARGSVQRVEPLWLKRAREAGTLRQEPILKGRVTSREQTMHRVITAWAYLHAALVESPDAADRALAGEVKAFVKGTPMMGHVVGLELERQQDLQRQPAPQPNIEQEPGPGW
ncbi:relaxase/mobilization nuclease domain-containing protein [Azohydromonas australica]|uniref:relaxase/mobilization nuclease domain-containing protein n=1 Tax=Azohydromonas australica TaxID=364039 RepID=UPI000416B2EA|nr:hypothetical protein [Azohydromonas australica]